MYQVSHNNEGGKAQELCDEYEFKNMEIAIHINSQDMIEHIAPFGFIEQETSE